jgi:ATP-dependent Clp protease ATP-binding subunit ClpC
MFERYTEKARRVIFFARYEASQFGSPYIETEHLLLGLLREDKALTYRFLRGQAHVESIRKQIEQHTVTREKVSTSVDLPLSNEGKRVLAYAAEEAERLSHKHIGTEHLLLGLLREEKSFAAELLHERGLRLSVVREELSAEPVKAEAGEAEAPRARELGILADFSIYLTQLAKEERLRPLIGRDEELQQMLLILGRSTRNNAVLVGETGVGKRTIVEGLAQRAADDMVAGFAEGKSLVALDLAMVVTAAQHSARAKEFLSAVTAEIVRCGADTIFFFDELHALLAEGPAGAHEITLLLRPALLSGKVRCIAAATPEEYQAASKNARWLERCFLPVAVEPATEANAIEVLKVVKKRFEKFHSVQYTEEALKAAVIYSDWHVKNRYLPDKAIDLMDDAGAYVKMKYETAIFPQEIIESRKHIKLMVRHMENAIANHEFEKARFYSDEERKEREKLAELQRKHNIQQDHVGSVTEEHIAEALARWTGLTVESIRRGPAQTVDQEQSNAAKKPKGQRAP